jgi:hypothetical protein
MIKWQTSPMDPEWASGDALKLSPGVLAGESLATPLRTQSVRVPVPRGGVHRGLSRGAGWVRRVPVSWGGYRGLGHGAWSSGKEKG